MLEDAPPRGRVPMMGDRPGGGIDAGRAASGSPLPPLRKREQRSSTFGNQRVRASRSADFAARRPTPFPPPHTSRTMSLADGYGEGGGQRSEAALDPPQTPVHGVAVGREPLVRCALHFGAVVLERALEGLGNVLHDRAEGLALRLLRLTRAPILAVLPDLHLRDLDLKVALVAVHGGGSGGGVCLAGDVVGAARSSAA